MFRLGSNINLPKFKINLPKFSDYELKLDIYSFQSEFWKTYELTTPKRYELTKSKRMMQNLLKKNMLKESALSMAKSIADIVDTLLNGAYGNPKLLLKKRCIADWEYQSTMENKRPKNAGGCFK